MIGVAVVRREVAAGQARAGDCVRISEELVTVAEVVTLDEGRCLLGLHGGEGLLVSADRQLTVLRPVTPAVRATHRGRGGRR